MPSHVHVLRSVTRLGVLLLALTAFTPTASSATISIYDNFADYVNGGGAAAVVCNFDPATTTTLVSGANGGPACFLVFLLFASPEAPDTSVIYHVGEPGGDGCVAGVGPGLEVGEGSLWINLGGAQSVALDIGSGSGTPVTVHAYDNGGELVASSSSPIDFVGIVTDGLGDVGYVELIPGTSDGNKDPTCFDNLQYGFPPLQTGTTTWGRLKALHR